ncbi:flagellar motor protein MotA [Dongia sp.]|uniref:flagellar motor protein MotA n=1 Tax=Dongia sp. TaxID=1977262 RepID=UPI003751B10A
MSRPTSQLLWMIVGLLAAGFVAGWLWDQIVLAFFHNPFLNSFILGVLAVGALYLFWQVIQLNSDISWVENFRTGGHKLSSAQPRLLAPMAAMLRDKTGGKLSLSASAMRSLLDGIQSRLDESREISRYLTGLLIFLGLLGTFWGLLNTIDSVAAAIKGMKVGTNGDPASMFESLKQSLEGPLSGMGIAFSASLFGLSGSLLLGYLDLRAGQAQARFFNELEDWLSGQTRISSGGALIEGDQPVPAYIQALLEQTAESLGELQRTIGRAEDNRHQQGTNFKLLADQIGQLNDQLRTEQQVMQRLADSQGEMRMFMQRLGELASSGGFGLDANSRNHLRNIDGLLNRLADDLAQGRTIAVQDLRSEIKVLTRTIAVAAGLERTPGS